MGWINSKGTYYEGDRQGSDTEATRPAVGKVPVIVDGSWTGSWADRPLTTEEVNQQLELAFLGLIPGHLGEVYLTNDVILAVAQAKTAVMDFIRLGQYQLAGACIAGLSLPTEMESDRSDLIASLTALVPE